jgi:hypothetical protein
MTDSSAQQSSPKMTTSYKYIAINIGFILLLLLLTELVLGETVLQSHLILGLAFLFALFPLACLFIGMVNMVGPISALLTLITCGILFLYRFKVNIFYIEYGGDLSTDDGNLIKEGVSSSGIMVVFNTSDITIINKALQSKPKEEEGSEKSSEKVEAIDLKKFLNEKQDEGKDALAALKSNMTVEDATKVIDYLKKVSEAGKVYVTDAKFGTEEAASSFCTVLKGEASKPGKESEKEKPGKESEKESEKEKPGKESEKESEKEKPGKEEEKEKSVPA